MGRKSIDINLSQLKKLVDAGWSEKQICDFFGCKPGLIKKKHPRIMKCGPKKIQFTDAMIRQVEALSTVMCTQEEIAATLGIGVTTFKTHKKENPAIQTALENGRAKGRMSLRRKQYNVAMNGNATMLIWLGKQYLEQDDRQQVDVTAHHGIAYLPQPETPEEFEKKSQEFLKSFQKAGEDKPK